MAMGKITLGEYIKMLENSKMEEAYKIFEKYGKQFEFFLDDPRHYSYWTVCGEAEQYYGTAWLFESKDSLLGKVGQGRPSYFDAVLNNVYKDDILKHMPSKCSQCGFHRFFGLKIVDTSIGQYITIFCPSCRKEFGTIDADSGDYKERDENSEL